jgi:uncharacterized membrane protein
MIKTKSWQAAVGGLLAALGVILPFLTSHAFGIAGTVLLPMHIPVLLCGLLCGYMYGAACGAVVPVLSSMITGMPAPYPMLPIMIAQLFILGLVSGLLGGKLRIYFTLPISIICGWAAYGLMFGALLLGNSGLKALSVTAAVTAGIPGLAVQIVLVPAVLAAVKKIARF